MAHKNDYSIIVFLENSDKPKSWTYVHNLNGFASFLDNKHPTWKYMNVYERRTRNFLKRLYRGNQIPSFLLLFFLTFNIAVYWATFINGFNNPTTIPILCL